MWPHPALRSGKCLFSTEGFSPRLKINHFLSSEAGLCATYARAQGRIRGSRPREEWSVLASVFATFATFRLACRSANMASRPIKTFRSFPGKMRPHFPGSRPIKTLTFFPRAAPRKSSPVGQAGSISKLVCLRRRSQPPNRHVFLGGTIFF